MINNIISKALITNQVILYAFKLVFYYLYIFDKLSNDKNVENIYSYIIKEICDFEGDTDTNCCIVGVLLDQWLGFIILKKIILIFLFITIQRRGSNIQMFLCIFL